MIQTKEDLRLYLEKDKQALGITRKRPCLVGDDIWKFEIALRYHEYLKNVNGGGGDTPYSSEILGLFASLLWNTLRILNSN